jgi:hypothetical protein
MRAITSLYSKLNEKRFQISEYIPSKVLAQIPSVLVSLGMLPLTPVIQSIPEQALMVMLDGRIVGYILDQIATSLVPKLRMLKIVGEKVRDRKRDRSTYIVN